MHVITIVHSAVNMQPINDQLEALAGRATEKESARAEEVARNWITGNYLRVITPPVARSLADCIATREEFSGFSKLKEPI